MISPNAISFRPRGGRSCVTRGIFASPKLRQPLPDAQRLSDLLNRTSDRTTVFLDQFSDVKCTEQVHQEKLGKDDKIELKEDSTYDYLVILTNSGGELNLAESRLPLHQAKRDRKNTSMLLSNGFATLFLVFHPYYSARLHVRAGRRRVSGWANAGKGQLSACSGHEVASRTGFARTRVSIGAHRHSLDRSPDRIDRQNRGRNRGFAPGCWLKSAPIGDRLRSPEVR